jgi:hypothetical protein
MTFEAGTERILRPRWFLRDYPQDWQMANSTSDLHFMALRRISCCPAWCGEAVRNSRIVTRLSRVSSYRFSGARPIFSKLVSGRFWREAAVPRHFRLWGQSETLDHPPRPLMVPHLSVHRSYTQPALSLTWKMQHTILPKRRLMVPGLMRPRESHRAHFLARCLCPTAVDNEVGEVLWKRRSGLPQHQLGRSRTA